MSTIDNTSLQESSQLESKLGLSEKHFQMLKDSAISDEVICERGYKTITDLKILQSYGFSRSQQLVPCLLLPIHTPNGEIGPFVIRPDRPRNIKDKVIKYEYPAEQLLRLDCPPRCQKLLSNPSIPIYITEGQKKADSLASKDLCAIALQGVWTFKGKNEFGGNTLLSDFDLIAFNDRIVYITFDSDVVTKPSVQKAMKRLAQILNNKKADVKIIRLPMSGNNFKQGVDDFFNSGGTVDQLNSFAVDSANIEGKEDIQYEIVDQHPEVLDRPIKIITGKAYCVVNVPVRPKKSEKISSSSNTEIEIQQLVLCEDGKSFGAGGNHKIDELPFRVQKEINILPMHQWSPVGVKKHLRGEYPDMAIVFRKIKEIFNQFIDFDNSLFDQEIMCDFCACYVFSTWFIDGLSIVGYLWITGEKGSGKSTGLQLFTELGYLGIFILPSSTFATMRDLASYGAVLGIDDAENITKPNPNNQDKHNLYLAGNRRGAFITLKEPQPDKSWATKFVPAFCPKIFSAISMPDSVLSSRCIVIPMVKSADLLKANADVSDYETWNHDRQEIIDDMYAVSLKNISRIAQLYRLVGQESQILGRELQPFRGVLTVAYLLEENGVSGIRERMKTFLEEYQTKRIDFEVDDRIYVIVRALFLSYQNAISATKASHAITDTTPMKLTVESVSYFAKSIAKSDNMEVAFLDLSNPSIGRTLSRLGLKKTNRQGGKGSRTWRVTKMDIFRLSKTYNVELSPNLRTPNSSSDNSSQLITGINGIAGFVGINNSQDSQEFEVTPSYSKDEPQVNPAKVEEFKETPNIYSHINIDEPCYACGKKNWKERPKHYGGGYYCATCHPS